METKAIMARIEGLLDDYVVEAATTFGFAELEARAEVKREVLMKFIRKAMKDGKREEVEV